MWFSNSVNCLCSKKNKLSFLFASSTKFYFYRTSPQGVLSETVIDSFPSYGWAASGYVVDMCCRLPDNTILINDFPAGDESDTLTRASRPRPSQTPSSSCRQVGPRRVNRPMACQRTTVCMGHALHGWRIHQSSGPLDPLDWQNWSLCRLIKMNWNVDNNNEL